MNRTIMRVAGIILLIAIALGCSEENNTYVVEEGGVVYGRVSPVQHGISVAAWQESEKASTKTDAGGYFALEVLPAGLYEIRVTDASGTLKRKISGVAVDTKANTTLGVLIISDLPWPLLATEPLDGQSGVVVANSNIYLLSDAALDLNSLNDEAKLLPATDGIWERDQYPTYPFRYEFHPVGQLKLSTSYTLIISQELALATGEILSDRVEVQFETDAFHLTSMYWNLYGYDTHSVPPGYTGRLVSLMYSGNLNGGSLSEAVSISPTVDVQAVFSEPSNGFEIHLGEGLVSGTEYTIVIDSDLLSSDGTPLEVADTIKFASESFRATSRSYPNSRISVSPLLTGNLLNYTYNVALDQASLLGAISVDPHVDLEIRTYNSYGNGRIEVGVPSGLTPSTLYTLTISGQLACVDGAQIGEDEIVTFETEDLQITRFGDGSYYESQLDTLVDPGTFPNLRISFNANVNEDSLTHAMTISPEISGFWVKEQSRPDYRQQDYTFFPTGLVDLLPEQTYTFFIDGSVGLSQGVGLVNDVEVRLRTRPVMIESLTPASGSSISQYQDIQIRFNVPMDKASAEAAFSLTTYDGEAVTGYFSWYRENDVRFDPTSDLQVGQSYKVTITTTAMSKSGRLLKRGGTTFFRVTN